MKAILKFDLKDEKFDFILATNAYRYYRALTDLAEHYRRLDKYSEDETINISQLREHFHSTLRECDANLNIDEVL